MLTKFFKTMDSATINIINTIGDAYGVEATDGQKVYEFITKAIEDKKKVNVSFQNIEMVTTAFLNSAIGQLYKNYSEDFIRENIQVSNISNSGKIALKRVVDTAKLYFKDPEALKRSIEALA